MPKRTVVSKRSSIVWAALSCAVSTLVVLGLILAAGCNHSREGALSRGKERSWQE